MNKYILLEKAIISSDINFKEESIKQFLEYCSEKNIENQDFFEPVIFESPSYSDICTIVEPRELPTRKDFDKPEGLATLVHSVAHIEYSAIDLAIDAVYRYPQMPMGYKEDWLEVALDEIRHFRMLDGLLNDLGFKYGDFSVHSGLFDVSMHTAGDIVDRMAVVPRYYEASGLDATPNILKKLHNKRKNPFVKKFTDSLEIIYDEEIDHVRKGDKWFRYLCEKNGYDPEEKYIKVLESYSLLSKHRPHINVEARKNAGFSCNELIALGAKECK